MLVYLDNAATTRVLEEAAEAASQAMLTSYGNPSSLHGMGLSAERLVSRTRESLAAALGVAADAVHFTSGGTEANNLALKGAARARARRGRHVLVSPIEHESVLRALDDLQDEGFEVERLPVDASGRVTPAAAAECVRPDTILVSVGAVNNETGTVQPLPELARAVRAAQRVRPSQSVRASQAVRPGEQAGAAGREATSHLLVHTDAVQALGKIPLRATIQAVDLATVSAHKIHGPKGVGALYARPGLHLRALAQGGEQEGGLRPGTENVPGIAAFGVALQALGQLEAALGRMRDQKANLLDSIRTAMPDVEIVVNGPALPDAAPHILNLSFPGIRGEVLVHALEEHGVFVSTGSACTSRDPRPSHVLQALGAAPKVAAGAIRISLSRFTTDDEIAHAAAAIAQTVPALLAFAGARRGGHRHERRS